MRGLWGDVEREREETREESEREDRRLRDGGLDLGREWIWREGVLELVSKRAKTAKRSKAEKDGRNRTASMY